MKKQILTSLALFIGLLSLQAQVSLADELALVQKIWGMEKKAIISQYMQFTDAEAAAFWPVYEKYAAAKDPINKNWLGAIATYAENYPTMNDEIAGNVAKTVIDSNLKREQLRKKSYKSFSKALSPMRATQFYQIETHMETAIRYELQMSIPFIGELDFNPAR